MPKNNNSNTTVYDQTTSKIILWHLCLLDNLDFSNEDEILVIVEHYNIHQTFDKHEIL